MDSLRGKLEQQRMYQPVQVTSQACSATKMEFGQELTLGRAGPPCSNHHRAHGGTGAAVGLRGWQSGEELDAEQRRAKTRGTQPTGVSVSVCHHV